MKNKITAHCDERKITVGLMQYCLYRLKHLVTIPQKGMGRFIADLYTVDKNDRSCEFEIKRSRGDFFNDAKKGKATFYLKELGPVRFYYVAPEGMILASELPEWAGLIEFTERQRTRWEGESYKAIDNWYVRWDDFSVVRRAKVLHDNIITPDNYKRMCGVISYRIASGNWNDSPVDGEPADEV